MIDKKMLTCAYKSNVYQVVAEQGNKRVNMIVKVVTTQQEEKQFLVNTNPVVRYLLFLIPIQNQCNISSCWVNQY